jgi:opacity protein-like surface antigen
MKERKLRILAVIDLGDSASFWRRGCSKSCQKEEIKMIKKYAAMVALTALSLPCASHAEGAFSGFYGGASAAYLFNGTSEITEGTPSVYDFDIKGSQIGLIGGYNFQSGSFVFGVEADANFGKAKDSQAVTVAPITYNGKAELGNYYSLRARIGVTPSENLLVYGTAGPAWGELSSSTILTGAALGPLAPFKAVEQTLDVNGYVLGIGGQYNLSKTTSIRLEYSELYLNDAKFTSTSPFGGTETFPTDNSISAIRTGVTFRY